MKQASAYRFALSLVALPTVWVATTVFGTALESATSSVTPTEQLECGRHLTGQPEEAVPLTESVRVVLVTDEEWRAAVHELQPSGARHTLLDAASLFRGISIHLLPVRIVDWSSPESAVTIRDIWQAARETVPLEAADIVVVLTAQERTTSQDGYANVGGQYVAVAHHPQRQDRDALVLAHEVSHLFGAHHGCDVEGRGGLMAPQGFDHDLVCPCTRRVLELNANRFHDTTHE